MKVQVDHDHQKWRDHDQHRKQREFEVGECFSKDSPLQSQHDSDVVLKKSNPEEAALDTLLDLTDPALIGNSTEDPEHGQPGQEGHQQQGPDRIDASKGPEQQAEHKDQTAVEELDDEERGFLP